MLAASLSSAALASRLRLSGTLALDPDMSAVTRFSIARP